MYQWYQAELDRCSVAAPVTQHACKHVVALFVLLGAFLLAVCYRAVTPAWLAEHVCKQHSHMQHVTVCYNFCRLTYCCCVCHAALQVASLRKMDETAGQLWMQDWLCGLRRTCVTLNFN